jgi:hypothetical protein
VILLGALLAGLTAATVARSNAAPDSTADPWQNVISPDRPGAANPTSVVRPGEFQIETCFESSISRRTGAASITTLDLPTLLRLGVAPRLELRIASNALTRQAAEGSGNSVSGFADVSIEAKAFVHQGAGGIVPSLAFLPSVSLPVGADALSAGKTLVTLSALCDWPLRAGPTLSLNLNLARIVDDTGNHYAWQTSSQAAVGVPLSRAWAISGDVFVADPFAASTTPSWSADAGLEFYPDPDIQLDVSVVVPVSGPTRTTGVQIGFSRRWSPGPARHPGSPGASPARTTSQRP